MCTSYEPPAEPARRRRGDGIKRVRLADGRVRYRFKVDVGPQPKRDKAGRPVLDDEGRPVMVRGQRTITVDSLREARELRARILADRARGTYVHPTRLSVAEAADKWLAGRRNLRPTSQRAYRDALRVLIDQLGPRPVQTITKADVDAAVSRALSGRSARTIALGVGLLSQVFEDLVDQGVLARNVARLVERPRVKDRERKTWTVDQLTTFLDRARADRYAVAWLLAARGLRRGEVAGLRWEDVDLVGRTLTIRNARTVYADEVFEGEPKTDTGRRTLLLDDELVAALDELRLRQREEAEAAGEAYRPACQLCGGHHVVVDELGRPVHPAVLSNRFRQLAQSAGLPAIRLHDLRHTCATLLHLRGTPTAVVAKWLGHARASFTLDTYTHAPDAELAAAVDTLSGLLRPVPRVDGAQQ